MKRAFREAKLAARLWRNLLCVAVALGAGFSARADVALAPLFRDGAVLQRDKPLVVWGTAKPREKVTITFGAARGNTVADKNGRWRVTLPALSASATGTDLVATGRNRVVVHDVLVGEVWLCSGQSNMMMAASGAQDAASEAAAAHFPLIRQFKVPSRFAATPQDSVAGAWQACSPSTFGGFSAVTIFFARDLWRQLGVPIGIVNASYGNTPIASWREPGAVAVEPAVAQWWSGEQKHTPPPRPHRQPSACYNGMVYPLEPYTVRGVLWYQGESDASDPQTLTPVYHRQFSGLIAEWRQAFEQPELPFLWVQLAGFGKAAPRDYVGIRAQQSATLAVPHTGQAIAIDVGDPTNIHPKNKQAVGDRLARLALHRVYGRPVEDAGPEPMDITRERSDVRIRFAHASGGLVLKGDGRSTFAVAGADGRFVPVSELLVDGDSVVVAAFDVPEPVRVRFSYQDLPTGALYNREGLPAGPFERDISKP